MRKVAIDLQTSSHSIEFENLHHVLHESDDSRELEFYDLRFIKAPMDSAQDGKIRYLAEQFFAELD